MSLACVPAARRVAEVDACFAPTIADEYAEAGYQAGLEGDSPAVEDLFWHHSPATRREGTEAFYQGVIAGRSAWAERLGREAGLAGRASVDLGRVHRRFRREFAAGWARGDAERAERERLQAEWAADMIEAEEERELERHNREVMGWPVD